MPDEVVSARPSRLAIGSFASGMIAAAPVLVASVIFAICGYGSRSPGWIPAVVCLVPVFPLCALAGLGLGAAGVVNILRKKLPGMGFAVTGLALSATYFVFILTFFGYRHLTAPELNATNAMRQYAEEQASYKDRQQEYREAPGGEYASDYNRLRGAWYLVYRTKLPTYRFRECSTIGGKPIDWRQEFAICATPFRYRFGAQRTFIVQTDGSVWSKDLGKSEFVADFPVDPAKEGWLRAE